MWRVVPLSVESGATVCAEGKAMETQQKAAETQYTRRCRVPPPPGDFNSNTSNSSNNNSNGNNNKLRFHRATSRSFLEVVVGLTRCSSSSRAAACESSSTRSASNCPASVACWRSAASARSARSAWAACNARYCRQRQGKGGVLGAKRQRSQGKAVAGTAGERRCFGRKGGAERRWRGRRKRPCLRGKARGAAGSVGRQCRQSTSRCCAAMVLSCCGRPKGF